MAWVAGVDGCKGGWFVVLRDLKSGHTCHRLVCTFAEVVTLPERPKVIAVDIPIGLLDEAVRGGRDCDRQARALLKPPRASSVFSPPVRAALSCKTFRRAGEVNRGSDAGRCDGPGVTKQSFALFTKLREVDKRVTRALELFARFIRNSVFMNSLDRKRCCTPKGSKRGRMNGVPRLRVPALWPACLMLQWARVVDSAWTTFLMRTRPVGRQSELSVARRFVSPRNPRRIQWSCGWRSGGDCAVLDISAWYDATLSKRAAVMGFSEPGEELGIEVFLGGDLHPVQIDFGSDPFGTQDVGMLEWVRKDRADLEGSLRTRTPRKWCWRPG